MSQISKYSGKKNLLLPKTRFCLFLSIKYDSVTKNEAIILLGEGYICIFGYKNMLDIKRRLLEKEESAES